MKAQAYVEAALRGDSTVPDGTVVKGNIRIVNNPDIIRLPEGVVRVEGAVIIQECKRFRYLPNSLEIVTMSLSLFDSASFTSLPKKLKYVGFDLDLYGCPQVKDYPEIPWIVDNTLDIGNTSLSWNKGFPIIKGDLLCDSGFIDSIPYEQLPLWLHIPMAKDRKEYLKKRLKSNI